MNKWHYLLLAGGLYIVSACSKRVLPSITEAAAFEALAIKATITYKDADTKLQGLLHVRIRHDSLIWVSISPPIGIELFRGIATQEGIALINRLQRRYVQYSYDRVASQWGVSANYLWLERLLLGQPLLDMQTYKEMPPDSSTSLHLQATVAALEIDTWIDKDQTRVRTQRITHPQGSLLQVQYEYSPPEHLSTDSTAHTTEVPPVMPFPVSIHMTFSTTDTQEVTRELICTYRKINILPAKSTSFPFEVPSKYEKK